jgi:hypothetical protein
MIIYPDIQFHEIFQGHDVVMTNVFLNLRVYIAGFNIAVNHIFGEDNKMVMAGCYQGTNKAIGNPDLSYYILHEEYNRF